MNDSSPRAARSRWVTALKFVLVVAILGLVVRAVPWRDELRYRSATETRVFSGTIEGEWKSEKVHFRLHEPVVLESLPVEWRPAGMLGEVRELDAARSERTSWQPGMPRVFRDVQPRGLWIALGLLFAGVLATSARWWRLLGAAGCPTGYWNAVRLTFVGLFFNIVVPGLTGGDVVKAVLAARANPERRAAAAMSVLVDRLVGVLVLALLGAVTIVAQGDKFAEMRTPVMVGLGLAVLGVLAYSNRTLRALVRFETLLGKLPMAGMFRQIDEAVTVYSRKPTEFVLALLFSLVNQCAVMVALYTLGRSFGDEVLSFAQYVVVGSIGNIASAVPLTPGGIGVTEVIYAELFERLDGSWTIGFAVSVAWRLCMMSIGLFGGLFLLVPGGKITADERDQLATEST